MSCFKSSKLLNHSTIWGGDDIYRDNQEIWDDAAWRFDFLFNREKENGHDDREAARRVHCDIHAERRRFKQMRDSGTIAEDRYINAMRILKRMGVTACWIFDSENQMLQKA